MQQGKMRAIKRTDFEGTIFEPLLQLHDCPRVMYYCGDFDITSKRKMITIVGSRAHSEYARTALEYLIRGLKGQDVCIVSGLALGIDALAHRNALHSFVPTIAIPGSGLDESVLYPATNRSLAKQILQDGGLLLSEFEPTDRAARWTFPKRNRIMAAMSDLVVVIEAAMQSGTLITARQALELNKEVAVVPGSIFNEMASGSNTLLRDGAHVVTCIDDIVSLLGISKISMEEKKYDDIGSDEQTILSLLIQPQSRDHLIDSSQFDAVRLATTLSLLEIKGYTQERLGLVYKI